MLKNGVPNKLYHADKRHFSSTQIRTFADNPGKFQAGLIRQSRPTEAMLLGSVVHKLALEPDGFYDEYFVDTILPKNTKKGKEEHQAAVAEAEENGVELIDYAVYDLAVQMADAVNADPTARALLKDTIREQSGYFNCSETGLPLKIRPDAYKAGFCIDLKTTSDGGCWVKHKRDGVDTSEVTPDNEWQFGGFVESIRNFNYAWQACHYLRGLEYLTGKQYEFIWITVENKPPFAVNSYHCKGWRIDRAWEEMRPVLHRLKEYLSKQFNVMEV